MPAFTEVLLKSRRWLLNAKPRLGSPKWEQLLLVSPGAQELHVARCILTYSARVKKLKPSQRVRGVARWSLEEWDRAVDVACVAHKTLEAARSTSCSVEQIEKAREAVLSKWIHLVYCSCCVERLSEVKTFARPLKRGTPLPVTSCKTSKRTSPASRTPLS